MSTWQLPVGFYAIKALAEIRTGEAISLLNAALENSNTVLRAEATACLGSWLADFSDSGWSSGKSGYEVVEVSQETRQLRDVVIRSMIVLLDDYAMVNTTAGAESVNRFAAKALEFSGMETAKSALESWYNSIQSPDDATTG